MTIATISVLFADSTLNSEPEMTAWNSTVKA